MTTTAVAATTYVCKWIYAKYRIAHTKQTENPLILLLHIIFSTQKNHIFNAICQLFPFVLSSGSVVMCFYSSCSSLAAAAAAAAITPWIKPIEEIRYKHVHFCIHKRTHCSFFLGPFSFSFPFLHFVILHSRTQHSQACHPFCLFSLAPIAQKSTTICTHKTM